MTMIMMMVIIMMIMRINNDHRRAGGLSTSDRIVEVDGVCLDSADHEKAVAAIQVIH